MLRLGNENDIASLEFLFMQINVGARSLFALFSQSTQVTVPSFQRNYSWTRDQVDQFLLDIYESAETSESHFWGPIVLLRRPTQLNTLEIIDGQQRLTTAIVFLSILRDKALELNQPWVNPGLPGSYHLPSSIRNFLFTPPHYSEERFTGSYLIESVLRERIIADPQSPVPGGGAPTTRPPLNVRGGGLSSSEKKHTKELRDSYRQMNESLTATLANKSGDDEKTILVARLFRALTEDFEIHTMELSDEDDAYLLFESLNDRGLRLNPSDLLKTLTLREIRSSPGVVSVEQALETWDDAVDELGDYDFTKFLRHYLLTQVNTRIQNRRIFAEFKSQIEILNPQGALRNLQNLSAASDHYAQLLGNKSHSDPSLARGFARMNRYSDTHRVFLLGLLQSGLPVGDQQALARAIEFLSYRWISTGRNAQELETHYQSALHALLSNLTPLGVQQILDALIDLAPNDTQFKVLTQGNTPSLQRYLLLRIEESTGGAIAGTAEIEHLAPRNPGAHSAHWHSAVADDVTPDSFGFTYDDYVQNWGNLTLLEDRLNRSISNSTWPTKRTGTGAMKGISASNYNLNQVIKSKASWTAGDIRAREQWLIDCAINLVGETWVRTGTATAPMWPG